MSYCSSLRATARSLLLQLWNLCWKFIFLEKMFCFICFSFLALFFSQEFFIHAVAVQCSFAPFWIWRDLSKLNLYSCDMIELFFVFVNVLKRYIYTHQQCIRCKFVDMRHQMCFNAKIEMCLNCSEHVPFCNMTQQWSRCPTVHVCTTGKYIILSARKWTAADLEGEGEGVFSHKDFHTYRSQMSH